MADEAHISVEVAYRCAQQVRDVFHQDTPAQGRRLAARLVERLPTCPIPEIARLGRTLRKWKDAFLAYFDTGGASNAPHRSHQRNHRTRQTHRQRLPQPHQLQTPNAPHHRRPRRLHPHSTLKSPFICIWALLSSANDKHSSVAEHREGQPGNTAFSALNTPGYAGIGTSKGMAERQIVSLERQLLGRQRIELLH